MQLAPRRRSQRGASWFELAVCAMLFGIFLAVFLERALYYQEHAEKAAMELTVEHIRTGLRYRVADLILANRMSEIPTLADENPIDWLAEKPGNYLGERDSPPAAEPQGMWFFDRRNRELVYTVNNRRHFSPSASSDFTVRYRAKRIIAPSAGSGPGGKEETWVTLALVGDYRWLQ